MINVDLDAQGYPDTKVGREAALKMVMEKCRQRLEEKAGVGFDGWNDPQWIAEEAVAALEHKFHVTAARGFLEKDVVDVINFCVFILAAYEKKILTDDGLVEPVY